MRQRWNPRYLAYCRAQGRTPRDQLRRDRRAWPGGCMAGFITWLGARWAEWEAAQPPLARGGDREMRRATAAGDGAFDLWLDHWLTANRFAALGS